MQVDPRTGVLCWIGVARGFNYMGCIAGVFAHLINLLLIDLPGGRPAVHRVTRSMADRREVDHLLGLEGGHSPSGGAGSSTYASRVKRVTLLLMAQNNAARHLHFGSPAPMMTPFPLPLLTLDPSVECLMPRAGVFRAKLLEMSNTCILLVSATPDALIAIGKFDSEEEAAAAE